MVVAVAVAVAVAVVVVVVVVVVAAVKEGIRAESLDSGAGILDNYV